MSGDWMKVELELPDKPEVFRISGILGLDPDAVVGKLIRVWSWFDKHTETGNAAGVTYALVDRITNVVGFAEAMALSGWLEQKGSELILPKFDLHNGKTAKNRALTAKRVASHKGKSNAEGNADSVSSSVTNALPREEKRREEKEQEKPGSGEPAPPPAEQAKRKGQKISLQAFLDTCRELGEAPIPADGAVFAYAAKVGLPEEYLALSWRRFKANYAAKKQVGVDGWRQTFLSAVKGNWGNLWAIGRQGEYYLTTVGKQAQRDMESEESE